MIAKCTINNRKISQVGYIPCLSQRIRNNPEVSRMTRGGSRAFDFMNTITRGGRPEYPV